MNNKLHTFSLHLPNTINYQNQLYALLSTTEKKRAQCTHTTEKKEQFILARGVLRLLLSQALNIKAACVQIEQRHSGKPFIHSSSELHFNVSHSFEYAVFALSDHNVGIDIEYCDPQLDIKTSFPFLHPQEKHHVQQKAYDKEFFFELWTHKKAWAKLHGDLTHEDWSNWFVPDHRQRISLPIHHDYKSTCIQHQAQSHRHRCLTTYSLQDLLNIQ